MAIFDKEIKSNRLLQSKRYTIQDIDAQEAYTNVLDLNSTEIYTQQNLLPTSSLPYSGSAQDGLYITDGSSNIARYYWRMRLTPTKDTVDSSGNSGGNLAQAWVPISGAASYNAISLQEINSDQVVNWISNKYIRPDLNLNEADSASSGNTPGYNISLFKNTVSNNANNAQAVPGNDFQFDYKTGVVQFTSPSVSPNKIHYLYLSGYVYVGKTLAEETFGSTVNTGSLLTTASISGETIQFTKGNGDTFDITVPAGDSFPYTGSALITGSLGVTGSINSTSVTSSFKGNLDGTASTASYVETAQTASYVETAQTASYVLNAISSSYALTASYAVSASHEIVKEVSSSYADVAEVARGLENTPSISVTNITASGAISSSKNLFISASESNTADKVALYDSSTGEIFYTASSAIGGGTDIKATGSLSGSSPGGIINTITIRDFDSDVLVKFDAGDLQFIFGTPSAPTPTLIESGFIQDKFNLFPQTFTLTGNFNLEAYDLISASLEETSPTAQDISDTNSGTSLFTTFTSRVFGSGQDEYQFRLQLTSSNPATSEVSNQTATETVSLNKSVPGNPSNTFNTTLVEGGVVSGKIEYNATGSVSFTGSKSGTDNEWTFVSMESNQTYAPTANGHESISGSVNLNSLAADATLTINTTANYNSGNLNAPQLTTSRGSGNQNYTRTRSVRTAVFPSSQTGSFESDYFNMSLLEKSGSINRGTINPNNLSVTLTGTSTTEGNFQYILIDNTYTLSAVEIGGNNYLTSTFNNTFSTSNGWKIYKSNELGDGTTTYLLKT